MDYRRTWQRNRLGAFSILLLMIGVACGGGRVDRTIFVDFQHDEFASFFIKNFPSKVTVAQGDELVFRQFWTGEPHSVTGGTLADDLLEKVRPYIQKATRGQPVPDDPPKAIEKLEERLVWALTESDELNQTAAQPCYLAAGEPRKDGKACTKRQQRQPVFTGKDTFYNSGLIPYEGQQGNEYRVKLADDVDPGSYWFYCNVHGEFQSTEVVVKPKGSKVQTAAEVSRAAREEISEVSKPLLKLFGDAQDERITIGKKVVRGNFAGLLDPNNDDGAVNEFVPRKLRVKAGKKITWNMFGYHSISFGVPSYLPILTFAKNGTVSRNPKLDPPAGGAKRFNIPEKIRYGGKEPVDFDGGTYDGKGFWSSGVIDAEPYIRYTMRIKKPGTYRYACLIHPPMVGTLEVT